MVISDYFINNHTLKPLSFFIIIVLLSVTGKGIHAQQVDSIFFHLYTDSLKKGTYNYINVDGKTHEGRWTPLTSQQINFTSSGGKFEGNNLVLDKDFKEDSVTVTAGLKANSIVKKTVTIYIKKIEYNEKLKTTEEIMREMQKPKSKNR